MSAPKDPPTTLREIGELLDAFIADTRQWLGNVWNDLLDAEISDLIDAAISLLPIVIVGLIAWVVVVWLYDKAMGRRD